VASLADGERCEAGGCAAVGRGFNCGGFLALPLGRAIARTSLAGVRTPATFRPVAVERN
jgi:hypothetical protein